MLLGTVDKGENLALLDHLVGSHSKRTRSFYKLFPVTNLIFRFKHQRTRERENVTGCQFALMNLKKKKLEAARNKCIFLGLGVTLPWLGAQSYSLASRVPVNSFLKFSQCNLMLQE